MCLHWANEGKILSGGHPLSDTFWRIEYRQTRRGDELDVREGFWVWRENEQGAVRHIQVSKDGPAWCMADKFGVRDLMAKVWRG